MAYQKIRGQLLSIKAQKKWYRHLSQRAAVCLIMEDRPDLGPSLLMIQRAEQEGDPWSGQMAFPGGKVDCDDAHITEAALRELEEELGIAHGLVHRVGRLSDVLARPYRINRKPMVVSPLLCESSQALDFHPNEEVAEVLWIPLSLFLDPSMRKTMEWERQTLTLKLPCYYYQDKRIWGLSLMMIDELVNAISQHDAGESGNT